VLHNLRFFSSKCRLFHNATLFGSCFIHILNTGCAQIWKKNFRRQRVKKLQILHFTSQYMLSLLMFVVQNKNSLSTNNENHNLDTTKRNNLYFPQANLSIYQKGARYSGIKIFTNLPFEIKNVAGAQ
jgi:hypothetical protein